MFKLELVVSSSLAPLPSNLGIWSIKKLGSTILDPFESSRPVHVRASWLVLRVPSRAKMKERKGKRESFREEREKKEKRKKREGVI